MNPLHIDPDAARRAGFDRPILHGLCTYGIACRAVIEGFAGWDPERLASLAARFSAPVFPGDALVIDMWREGHIIYFEAQVPARVVKVIKKGRPPMRGTFIVTRRALRHTRYVPHIILQAHHRLSTAA